VGESMLVGHGEGYRNGSTDYFLFGVTSYMERHGSKAETAATAKLQKAAQKIWHGKTWRA